MKLNELYGWEVETVDHTVISQYEEDGSENPSTLIPVDSVVRASIIHRLGLGRHDVLISPQGKNKFIRRFGRGIIKNDGKGFAIAEYLHCIHTTDYRLWVLSSTGQALVSDPDFELYL